MQPVNGMITVTDEALNIINFLRQLSSPLNTDLKMLNNPEIMRIFFS